MKIVSNVGSFYTRLIQELIVNLPTEFNYPSADEFHKVHVHGVFFTIFLSFQSIFWGVLAS